MASIARRRAAHFAHFNDDGDDGDNNVHVGSDQARTLGPWSSAIELVNAREKAQHDRQAKLQCQGQQEEALFAEGTSSAAAAAAAGDAGWQPSRDPFLGPHTRDPVRPLFEICLDVLTAYVDCVESLWGVPDVIKARMAASACARRKMSPEVARLFFADSPSEVVLPECTQLDGPAMGEMLRVLDNNKLQRLELGFCGRGFGDESAGLLAAGGPLEQLESLELAGAYRLSDAGLEKVLSVAPSLDRLAVPQCPRLTGAVVDKLPALIPRLSHLDLADCRGVSSDSLVVSLPRMTRLRSLKLDGIPELDDAVLMAVGSLTQLRELSIRCCQGVTDEGLTALAATRGLELEVLRLDECGGKVTDRGVQALASQCKALRVFSARRCTRLGDQALADLLRMGTMRHLTLSGVTAVGPAVARALTSCCHETLEYLDMSFCRKLSDRCLGPLLDRCTRLRKLVVLGCSQLSPRSLYGHCNCQLVIVGLHTKVGLDLAVGSRASAGSGSGASEGGAAEGDGGGGPGQGEALPSPPAKASQRGSGKKGDKSRAGGASRRRGRGAGAKATFASAAAEERDVEEEVF
ncbi:hypothetical protein VOLCADRAFT_86557 [Volvox carteri f. nagariensis]|uniref:F-box/LRR-repeat protein 15-like leucin rich repeat domain-containing protein n=1 Tax=Volvox carteri f. nagariensis TaxID=3068 RepID=D8TIZ9_VOLCA|nr:uncharacterized protein VOLCADRAFT_86557 [Volvox carteri f. nagariensis]EFJ52453.1 hypothetical protein VOLCADRAFT_86557 [Volvox carteri f. nagariensis]|eukprot:XP_002946526.1 hypothetical protein VOLCADRAFT_86557 [Volvox carteri f. nagariensis]